MKKKICFKCNFEKPLDDFYKHPEMPDGHVNKCKECNKEDVKKDYYRKREDESWMESERVRSKERKERLNYTQRRREVWNIGKPWRDNYKYKNLRQKIKIPKEYQLHHWNYNDDYLEDVFILSSIDHSQLHINLTLDLEKRIFYLEDGTYLDTKEKHEVFIKNTGIRIYTIEEF